MKEIITQKRDAFEICNAQMIENFIKKKFAERLFVKYHFKLEDVDMSKQYDVGTKEQALQSVNKDVMEVKRKSDKDIFVDCVFSVLSEYYCIKFSYSSPIDLNEDNILFISIDCIDYIEDYETETDVDIEEAFLNNIDFNEIIDDVKKLTEEEIIKKYAVTSYDEDDFFFSYGISGFKLNLDERNL